MRRVWIGAAIALGMVTLQLSVARAAGLDDALQTYKAGDFAGAEKQLKGILGDNPEDAGARFWLARCLIEEGKFPAAEAELRRVLVAKPNSVDSRYFLGVALAGEGRDQEARKTFGEVLAQRPGDPEALAALARLGSPAAEGSPDADRRIAVSASGLALDIEQVDVLSPNVYDYTFSEAPTDWVPRGGIWKPTNRWACSPQWSWYGGYDVNGVAASWNKHEFLGDITVEIYAAMKMAVGADRKYKNPNDMNLTIHGDGVNPDSGYSFMMGGNLNEWTRIMKGNEVLAETRSPSAYFPIFEDGFPSDMYLFHRKWWGLRARLAGTKLQFYKDEKLILQADDPHPLKGGRTALWTMHNGIVISRAKIYYAAEKLPPDPVPVDEVLATPPVPSVATRAVTVDSGTHPAVYDDFETDTGHWEPRDPNGGVRLTLVSPGADGKGHALALIDEHAGGQFGASLKTPKLDARKFGRLAFDYKVDPDTKVNLQVVVNSGIYEIVFTAPGEIGPQAQTLAEIPDVKADGQWHHADVDLLAYLDRIYRREDPLEIEEVYFANTHTSGYIHAGFGGNHAGATLALDNFYLGGAGGNQVTLNWTPASGVNVKGCAVSVDTQRYGTPPETALKPETTFTTTVPGSGVYYAHLRPQLADGSWGPPENREIIADLDPPKVAARSPESGETSGAPVIAARLTDGLGSGLDYGSVKLQVQGKEFPLDGTTLRYEPKDERLVFDPTRAGMTFADGQDVAVALTAADRLGHALAAPAQWHFRYALARDKTSPTTPDITSASKYLCRDDFENDTDQWSTFGGPDGAVLCRDPSTAAGGQYSLRVYNYRQGSRFGAYVRKDAFDAGKYRLMSFDYKVSGRLRTDFALYANDHWRSIHFTDNDNPQPRIGSIPDVVTDGQWHHAEVNLYDMLRASDPTMPTYAIRYLILGDWGYMGNAQGRTYYIDNFEIAPVVSGKEPLPFSWETRDTSGVVGASYAFDRSPTTDPGTKKMVDGTAVKAAAPGDGVCWFHVRSVDKAGNWSRAGHLRLIVDREDPTAVVESPHPGERTATAQIAFKVADVGPAGIDPAGLKLKIAGQEYDATSPAVSYNAETGRLVWDGTQALPQPVVFKDGQAVEVQLLGAADLAGNAAKLPAPYTWTMDYSKDNEPPQVTAIRSTSHLTLVSNLFEDGLGQWQARPGEKGVNVTLDETTAASGKRSVKVAAAEAGSPLGAVAWGESFSVDRYPVVSFDYNFSPGTKLDLLVKMDDEWHAVGVTADKGDLIGRIPTAVADGKWHHASLQLMPLLRAVKKNGSLDVDELVFADREPYDNPAGATARFDNFIIGRVGRSSPTFRWTAGDATGITDYSTVLDQNPTTVPPETGQGPTPSQTFRGTEAGEWYFHVRAKDGAGHWGPPLTYAILHLNPRADG